MLSDIHVLTHIVKGLIDINMVVKHYTHKTLGGFRASTTKSERADTCMLTCTNHNSYCAVIMRN